MKKAFVGIVAGLLLVTAGFLWYVEFREPAVLIEGEYRPLDFNFNYMNTPPEDFINSTLENRSFGEHYTITSKQRMDEVVSADSWEELQKMHPGETYFMKNLGNSDITIIGAHIEHKPISIVPFAEGTEPYTIVVGVVSFPLGNMEAVVSGTEPYPTVVGVEKHTIIPGGDAGVWMKRTFNCTGRYEITRFGVDYIYEGKNYTTDLDFDPWIVDIVIKTSQ